MQAVQHAHQSKALAGAHCLAEANAGHPSYGCLSLPSLHWLHIGH
jgi:hypothetical protein